MHHMASQNRLTEDCGKRDVLRLPQELGVEIMATKLLNGLGKTYGNQHRIL